ncbi:MAG: PLP-dependent aminotransferase family protein [Spirochaetes bacterium]|nr:PLP-dependent aminotransferase family protein [Spirochaetota bacterium]
MSLLLKLIPDRAPYYQQIYQQIKNLIEDETLKPGMVLPSTRELANKLGVNRSTVCHAYDELLGMGYIESSQGSYTKVRWRKNVIQSENRMSKSILNWAELCSHSQETWQHAKLMPSPFATKNQDGVINMLPLQVDPRLFPLDNFRQSLNQVLLTEGAELFLNGDPQGYLPLREYLARRMKQHSIQVEHKNILITNGGQNALDLVLKTLIQPGDCIAVEQPTYAYLIPLLKLYQCHVIEIPFTSEGLDLAVLETKARENQIKLLFTMPNFQNPTGITTTQQHREKLLSISEKYHFPVLEDGFEEEMKYLGKVTLPIKSMDEKQTVLYTGTFSKVLFPGLRLGWLVADEEMISRISGIRKFCDISTSPLLQAGMYRFCSSGYYDIHIRKMHRIYRKRLKTALEALKKYLPQSQIDYTRPAGGYLIWFSFPEGQFTYQQLEDCCKNQQIEVSPGYHYFWSPQKKIHFRVSISLLDHGEIIEGIKRLSAVIKELLRL